MRFPIPGFVPVPTPETMRVISIVSLIVGISLVGLAVFFLFLGKGTNRRPLWTFMGVGALLILNHGLQLLFA